MVAAAGGWGTWEELILGGAVLRHGTNDWNDVASELRARTFYPCAFTPQACKERYEDLQKRYSGSKSWFEELRKQRVAELKLELARSEDSIGSLESKIKSLECEKKNSGQAVCGSNNENSAGSFTKDTVSWSCENQASKDSCVKILAESNYGQAVVVRKRRGQRSRKDCGRVVKKEDDHREESCAVKKDDHCEGLIGMFKAVAESEPASVFKHRMDSQKRARYRRVIKQHVDIGTIRSRIVGRSIKSVKELFRDLLLLANNALVFYSRRTREYKSAVSLRHVVMQELKKHCRGGSYCGPASTFIPCNPPVRPRTARPRPAPRPSVRSEDDVGVVGGVGPEGAEKVSGVLPDNRVVKSRKGLKKLKQGVIVDTENRNCVVKQRKRVRK